MEGNVKVEELIIESRKLPREERARFALELVRELERDQQPEPDELDVHAAWTDELRRRWDDVRTGVVTPLTLDQVREVVAARRKA